MGNVSDKVLGIFQELVSDRSSRLDGSKMAEPAMTILASALSDELEPELAHDIAFHLMDWNSDAAFIVAASLFPERFTAEELREGIELFLIHAPNHVAAAAHLGKWPIEDIFGLGLEIKK